MKRAALALFALLATTLGACGPVEIPVADGSYTAEKVDKRIDGRSRRDTLSLPDTYALKSMSLTVNREASTITLSAEGGEPITRGFTSKPVDAWPTACEGLIRDDAQEVLALDGPIEVGPLALKAPVVIARCPESQSIFLHEDPDAASCDQVQDGLCVELTR